MDVDALKLEFDSMTEKMTSLEEEKKRLEDKGTNGFHRDYNSVKRKIKKLNKNMANKAKEIENAAAGDFTKPEEAKL